MLSSWHKFLPVIAVNVISLSFITSAANAQGVVEPKSEVTLDLRARHDSNVSRSSDANALTRDLEQSDQRLTPTVGLELAYPFGRNSATVSASVGYDFYRRNTRLNSERITIDGGVNISASICNLGLDAGVIRRQSELGDIFFFEDVPAQTVENKETTHYYGANVTCGNAFGLQPSASVRRSVGKNTNPIRKSSDYTSTTVGTGLGYASPALGTFNLFARKTTTRFDDEFINFLQGDYTSRAYGIGYQRDIGARWTVNAELGYSNVDTTGFLANNFDGATYSISVNGRINPRLQVSGIFAKAVQTGLNNNASYTVNTTSGVSGSYAINDQLSVSAGYSYTQSDYFYNRDLPAGFSLTDDNQHRVDGSIRYALRPSTQLVFSAGYDRRNANGDFFDYKNSFASIALRQRF